MDCHYWDIATSIWDTFPPLSEPHATGGLVVVDFGPMAIGGKNLLDHYTNSVEVYNETIGLWEPHVDLPIALSGIVAHAINPKTIIVSGGLGENFSKVFKLVEGDSMWTKLEDLPFLIFFQTSLFLTLPELGTGILAIGGYTRATPGDPDQATRKAYFWDITVETWELVEQYNWPTGNYFADGIMYRFGNKLIASPFFERANGTNYKPTKSMLAKDLTNISAPWTIYETNIEKGAIAQFGIEIDDYAFS
ncbi:uncharacterized protein LOC131877870 [Tigriopus californicus]|uniref:uncharacterized protein LOC131877870 n=1 Tax=Tigriopus californicus TaxID=6832 RepID=UPI0027DA7E55|nr:uncharacterized protein LOC131877870 [Tigriopus californicus]